MRKGVILLVIGSLGVGGCATEGGTVLGGTGTGAVAGGALGAILGDRNGAVTGALVGAVVGTAAGAYVAGRKRRYANVEDRIAGERQVASAAIDTANEEVAASRAQLAELDPQLAALRQARLTRQRRAQRLAAIAASLRQQDAKLATQRSQLEQTIKDQQAFVDETAREVGRRDRDKAAQLAAWKADIPRMRLALDGLVQQTTQVGLRTAQLQRLQSDQA